MNIKKYNIILLAFSLLISCSKEANNVTLGDSINVTAEVPDEGQDLEFIWELTNIPQNSIVDNSVITLGENSSSINFIPDVPGTYGLEVSIFQYNDEISTESFSYNVVLLDDDEIQEIAKTGQMVVEQEEQDSTAISELLSENNEPKWYDSESINDLLEESMEDSSKNTSIKKLEAEKTKNISKSPKEKKKVTRKINKKPKSIRGSSIPHDKDRFTIQVGSKKVLSDAKKFAAKLIDVGYDAYIQKALFKETNEVWYRIRVGSYDKKETAVTVAKALSKTRKERAWVDFVRYEY